MLLLPAVQGEGDDEEVPALSLSGAMFCLTAITLIVTGCSGACVLRAGWGTGCGGREICAATCRLLASGACAACRPTLPSLALPMPAHPACPTPLTTHPHPSQSS